MNTHKLKIYKYIFATLAITVAGCQNMGGQAGGGGSSSPGSARQASERWTICCIRTNAFNHREICNMLTGHLRRVPELDPSKIRLDTTSDASAIYYGEYTKIADKNSDELIFPPQYQKDIETIRRLSLNRSTPFFEAHPEVIGQGPASSYPQWNIYNAKGAYSLHIAVFYNTASFDQRREAAEQAAEALREAGYTAYFWHGQVKSHVFANDFYENDVIQTPEGPRFGPRVEEFVAQNEKLFKHVSENGVLRKRPTMDGQTAAPLSRLIRVPRRGEASEWE